MKKGLCITLAILMVLALFTGCKKEPNAVQPGNKVHTLKAGYGRAEITPKTAITLDRHYTLFTKQMESESVLDPLYTTCIALTDENDNTVLLFQNDLFLSKDSDIISIKTELVKVLKVKIYNIFISTTHSSSGPEVSEKAGGSAVKEYYAYLKEQMLNAAKDAVNDMQDCQILTHTSQAPGLNANSEIPENLSNEIKEPEPDASMQMIRFSRATGKDILLVNYQCHPIEVSDTAPAAISADYIGAMRSKVESQLDCHFAFFNGASANLYPASNPDTKKYMSHQEMGEKLAQYVIDEYHAFERVDNGPINIDSKEIHKDYTRRSNSNRDLTAFSIGDVSFLAVPFEMYNEDGLEIKKASKFNTTFIIGYTDDYGTLHTEQRWESEYFEPLHSRPFDKAFTEDASDAFVKYYTDLLDSLYARGDRK